MASRLAMRTCGEHLALESNPFWKNSDYIMNHDAIKYTKVLSRVFFDLRDFFKL